jgi:hypothetical protein
MGRRAAAALAATVLGAGRAAAHHGWAWAEEEQTELRGTLRDLYLGYPHPTLRVQAADGLWIVELAPPGQTARAGFTADSVAPGDLVVAIGNRSRAQGERRMKAVRIIVRGRTFDVYPERIRGS